MNVYLCDIDGTLACHTPHRSPYDESKVLQDTPLPTIEVINSLLSTRNSIIFLSGRTEACREDTETWLARHLVCQYKGLHMRQIGDHRGDQVIKQELYNTHIKDRYNVLGVFDDRLKVCRMWYDLGLFVFNCNQGLKEF